MSAPLVTRKSVRRVGSTVHVFVYGTLTDPDRVASVVDSFRFAGDAELRGLHRVEGTYPSLAPGGRVPGRLLVTDERAALDAYEGVDQGLYVRVAVPICDSDRRVEVYVGDPEALAVDAPVSWPGSGPFAERVRAYVEANEVAVHPRDRARRA